MRTCTLVLFCPFLTLSEAQIDTSQFQSLEYRMIGPFRGGRTVGAVGIPTQPNVFFFGHNMTRLEAHDRYQPLGFAAHRRDDSGRLCIGIDTIPRRYHSFLRGCRDFEL